ncbi:hypothetical protein ABIF65_000601 [Bradyrhizobium japonicum]
MKTGKQPFLGWRPRPASPTADARPSLLEEHCKQILDIIQNMSITMERSPKAFATLEEEHLRFHFLMQLNGQYEGEALGEAFNYGGQTDILVRSGGHNLFIAECNSAAAIPDFESRLSPSAT